MIVQMLTHMMAYTAGVANDAYRVVTGDDLDLPPKALRSLVVNFDGSIKGKITRILGDDEDERVENLLRVLRGTPDEELADLLCTMQLALGRLAEEREVHSRPRRLSAERRREERRRVGTS